MNILNSKSDKINTVCVFGTRPEGIKMAPLVLALKSRPEFNTTVIVTAQHREQLDSVLRIFGITPDVDLNIMKKGQTLTDIVTKTLTGVGCALASLRPDIVLVHGDTATTFAASLAAFYGGAAVGHVEAGLRTYDKYQPYPEEMNRLLTARIADIHFSPTKLAKDNLIRENIPSESIFITGNTEIDAIRHIMDGSADYEFKEKELNRLDFSKRIIVMTAHRSENLGKPMEEICQAMRRVLEEHSDCLLVWPTHLNPEVRKAAYKGFEGADRVLLTEPLDVDDIFHLMKRSYLVATDSGGIQENAPALRKPVVVLRNVTERPEGLESGSLILSGNSYEGVYRTVSKLLDDKNAYGRMADSVNPFGDGRACGRIADALLYLYGRRAERPEEFS